MSRKLNINDIKILIENNGGFLLSKNYKNNFTKLKVKCEVGHVWNPTVKSLKRGGWCGICYNSTERRRAVKHQPHKIEEAKSIAEGNNGKCLTENYINNRTKLLFKCSKNHVWETTFKSVKNGSWCPYCNPYCFKSKNYQKALKIAHDVANNRNGKCLTRNLIKINSYLEWECALGHTWKAKYNNVIINNSWCPECSAGFSERICKAYFETIFGGSFNKSRPIWLKNDKGYSLELDGYNSKLGIAFEHHGLQHYLFNKFFFKSKEEFKNRQNDDLIKEKLCKENNVKLIIIPALFSKTKLENLFEIIKSESIKLNIIFPDINSININIDELRDNSSNYQDKLKHIKNLAIKNGGKCLSNKYISCIEKLKFQCGKCDYIWETTPISIKQGHWCIKCAFKIPITIEQMQSIAEERNGKCLSNDYVNNHTKLQWQCNVCNNIWNATYNAIQRGNWCPHCSFKRRIEKKKIPIEAYQKAAELKGGRCLSKSINSCYDKLEFECNLGHKWFSRADQIKNTNKWCPTCVILNK